MEITGIYCVVFLFTLIHCQQRAPGCIAIRGHPKVQQIPFTYPQLWKTWTCELSALHPQDILKPIEDEQNGGGWVNPTSFDTLFLPSDLPLPLARPALGLVMANGSPRYLMPSIVLTLETPDNLWRNRGLCSLPRADAWIDMFSAYAAPIESLWLSSFGQFAADVRFLEDQDGSTSWASLDNGEVRSMLRPTDSCRYPIAPTYDMFEKYILKKDPEKFKEIREGYHFIDIPLINTSPLRLPKNRKIRQFLSDFEEPRRLLELEDPNALDEEPCGELNITLLPISAGRDSEFLPEVRYSKCRVINRLIKI